MNIFAKRPLFLSCAFFLALSIVGIFIPGEAKLLLISIAFLVAVTFFLIKIIFKKFTSYTILCVVLSAIMSITALASSYMFFDFEAAKIGEYYDDYHNIEATVIDERYRANSLSGYDINVTKIDGNFTYHKATLSCSYDADLDPGDRIEARVYGHCFEDTVGSYSKKKAMFSDRIFIDYIFDSDSPIVVTEEDSFSLSIFFKKLNEKVSSIFSDDLKDNTAQICSALLLGNKDNLSPTVIRDFRRAGASHILALSGLHMSILMGFLLFILKKFRINRKICAIILSLCALFYLFLTGFQISAARSVIMLLCVFASWLFERTSESLTSLIVSATVLMLIFPGSVIDPAYWMSFAATLGILVYTQPCLDYMRKWLSPFNIPKLAKRIILKVISLFAVTLFATVPLIIVLCIFIRQYSFYSFISSIVLSIPTAGIIILSLTYLIFSEMGLIAGVISGLLGMLTDFMIGFCERLSDTENAVISLNYPFIIVLAVIIGLALIFSLASKTRNMFIALIPYVCSILILVCAISLYNGSMKDKIQTTYINHSSSSDMITLTDNVGNAVICDIGDGSKSSYYAAVSELRSKRVTEIDAVIISKYSNNQINAFNYLFSEEKVRNLYLPYPQNESEYYSMQKFKEIAENFGVSVSVYNYDAPLSIFEDTVIYVKRFSVDRSARPVLSLCVITDNDRFTYCPPAFNESDGAEIIEHDLYRSNYIVFGNYGPKTETPYEFEVNSDTRAIAFSDKIRAAYYVQDDSYNVQQSLVTDSCQIILEE